MDNLKLTAGLAALTLTILVHSTVTQAVDESASAVIKDTNGETVGIASFTQAPAGVLLKLSLTRMPPGEHAFHIHAVGKCDPFSFDSAGPIFNPSNTHHGILVGPGNAGDMPNLHIPPTGALEIELVNPAIALDKSKPNSILHPGGASLVIHAGKDDYTTDPDGNAGSRIACGVISKAPVTVNRSSAP